MLRLDQNLLIGKGHDRSCYRHPDYDDRCVKVDHSSNDKQSKQEMAYYSMLNKRGRAVSVLPAYYGQIETDLGEGAVYELIRDYDGNVSILLQQYLGKLDKNQDVLASREVVEALSLLRNRLVSESVVVRDLQVNNISVQRINDQEIQLILLDGFGNSDFVPLADYFHWYARMKIMRRWQRFENKIRDVYQNSPVFIDAFNKVFGVQP